MVILRKGKKTIKEYAEAYAVADDTETLLRFIPASQMNAVQRFIRQNAFGFSIYGAKARLGGGLMLETVKS